MHKLLIAAVPALALLAGIPANAMPLANTMPGNAGVTFVAGGCGPFAHRGPFGGCRPNGGPAPFFRARACPPGFHLGPYGRRCRPNF